MARYPNPIDSSRDTHLRRIAEIAFGGGLGGLASLASAGGGADDLGQWGVWVLVTVIGLGVVCWDERRLRRLDAQEWTLDDWDELRSSEYQQRRGLLLVHTATRCEAPAGANPNRHWWSVTVRLIQHSDGPLNRGEIAYVEYGFAPNFTEGTAKVRGPQDSYAYTTELWGPLLVLGRVHFNNRVRRPVHRAVYRSTQGPLGTRQQAVG